MLIAMAVWDTVENGRSWMTKATIESLYETVDFSRHRLVISDNGSCKETQDLLHYPLMSGPKFEVIHNGENLGTAAAINRAWRLREPGEHALKMDNDVTIVQKGWASQMEDVFARAPGIGICGLKRKDVDECPWSPNPWYKSVLAMLPHERGQRWLVVEEVQHVMGTCQAYSSALLDKIGYLVQPSKYGFDDSLAATRARVAGFRSVFLCGFEIDHIDPGQGEYGQWKLDEAGRMMQAFLAMRKHYEETRDVYYDGGFCDLT